MAIAAGSTTKIARAAASGTEISAGGEDLLILSARDVLAIVK